ncbi:putative ribonuclease H-like domain-containing protein [Tanacetum coccineum]
MAALKFASSHNMVAFLDKPTESDGFEQIVDFLNAHPIKYALTVNPTIYTSCIEQFWATAKVKTVNGEVQIQALVDKKKVIITETSLTLMGYENLTQKLTFYKAFFSPQWKFLIHTILQCLSAKTTAWNEFSSTMASAVICLATNQKFNFSKYIFDNMVKNLEGGVKFLMYPRFVQVFMDKQVEGMSKHKKIYVTPSHTKKVFANMKRQGKDFSSRDTPLFPTMIVQAQEQVGEGSEIPTDSHHTPTTTQPSTSKPQKKQSRRKQRKDTEDPQISGPKELVTDDTENVASVPTHSNDLLFSVKKLEGKRKSKPPGMKRLFKIGRSTQVVSSKDEGLGDQEDASKEGRKIVEIHQDANVTLVDETQGRYDDNLMFDTGVLDMAYIENLIDLKVKLIRCDNGTEFKNRVMNQFYEMKGIKREFSVARTPQQNGVAERKNRTLIEAARTMLADSKFLTTFWAEAVNTACYVQNRVLVIKSHNKTPYELFLGRKPALSFMRPFGCPVTILNTIDHLGSGPNWLFDIDALTKSINYKSVVEGNQSNGNAGTKACNDAGKARMEIVPGKDYILLPMWPADPLFFQVSKSFPDAGFKPSGKEEKNDAKDPGNEDSEVPIPTVNPAGIEDNAVDENIVYGCANDPNMPELEYIVYSDDDEDVGVEADIYNLDTHIPVSPIPTTRIHKDHPVEQIIGDIYSSPQTRSMTKSVTKQAMFSSVQQRTNYKDFKNCLFACFLSQEEPKKAIQALKDLSWIEAMQEELLQFKLQQVWTLVDLPNGKRAIGTKWVYKNKKDERGIVIRNKARLVAQEYIQEEGIYYDEMDIKSDFLYGKIEEEVYVCQPPGFEDPDFPDRVYKVEKELYGLHQAPRAWYETMLTYLLDNGFQRGKIDKTLFIKRDKSDILLVQVYVDDIIFWSTRKKMCTEFEKIMHKKFQMSYMGELTFFLGLQVKQKEDGIFIS